VSGVAQRSFHLLRAAAEFTEVHFRGLSQRAHQPDAGSLNSAAEALREVCSTVEVLPIPADRSRLAKAALQLTAPVLAAPYYARWLESAGLSEAVSRCVREHRPDLMHVDTVGLTPYALAVAPTPAVLNHHNIESQLLERRAGVERSPARRAYYRREARKLLRYEREVCRRVAGNIVVSDLDGERLRERVGDVATAVVPNGVDVEYFVPRAPLGHGDGGMIFVGGLDWYPNRDAVRYFLRDVWPELAASGPNRRLTLVGRDPPDDVVAAGSDSSIEVLGFVPDIRPLIDQASIYVCPIRDGGGTRLKILDALAMAKPLVATGLAVEGLGLTDGEHFLRADAPDEFVAQVSRLERDPGLRHRLAVAGRRVVEERFAWSCVGGQLEAAYARALSRRGDLRP